MYKNLVILASLVTAATSAAKSMPDRPEHLPADYKLVYEQDFDDLAALNDFRFTDPRAWRLGQQDENSMLALFKASHYEPPHHSPSDIAILHTLQLESFVLEADLLQMGREYPHRDLCVFFGFVSPARYYFTHFATRVDDYAHNIFIVNDKPRTKISTKTTQGVDWGRGEWHRVRLIRNTEDGQIEAYFDNMVRPIMTATDKHFSRGYVGFGSFHDTGLIDNVRIWAPKVTHRRAGELFAAKPLNPVEQEPDINAGGFRSMFDGRTLAGWHVAKGKASGKMEYTMDDGAIVGTCIPNQPTGFLRSDKLYRDFIFTCEAKFDVPCNSGIQFRGQQRQEDGRVYGYQCEMDENKEHLYSGAIYDSARRGWLFPLWGQAYQEARGAFHYGRWNRFTIKAQGRRLQTWVNGTPCADYTDTDPDDFTPCGFIALQVHGSKQGRIRWRKLKIMELKPSADSAKRQEQTGS